MRKRGTQFVPIKPIALGFMSSVTNIMYEHNGKRYMHLELTPNVESQISEIHKDSASYMTANSRVIDPKEGSTLKIKVPYKYNKVTCAVSGNKAVQELAVGDKVGVVLDYCGVWNVNNFSGPSWKLESIETF
jgi:hypothetical protein